MNIKTKIRLGVGFLFIMVLLMAVMATRYINNISKDTSAILDANYNTLEYCRGMLTALDETNYDTVALQEFKLNLNKQRQNITENGELQLTSRLEDHFEQFQKVPHDKRIHIEIRKDLNEIMNLNTQAIIRKNQKAQDTVKNATIGIALISTFCLLIALSLLVSFPGMIADPVKQLTESIMQIAEKDYSQRLYFDTNDEFEKVANAFNTMAAKLEEFESTNLAQLLFEKKRIDTIVNNMHDPVIGLDKDKRILFANPEAQKILALKEEQLLNKNAQEVALKNDLMRLLMVDLSEYSTSRGLQDNTIKIYYNFKESYFEKEIHEISIVPTGEEKSKIVGYVFILKNVTPFKELDEAKTNFIATISHELKTPVSSILLSLKLMEDERIGKINEEQRSIVQSVREEGERLLKITSELIKVSQVEAGHIQVSVQSVPVKEILDYAVSANTIHARQKNITLKVDQSPLVQNILGDAE